MGSDRLTEVLGAQPPASVSALPRDVRDRLAEQVEAARAQQQRLGDDAVATAIKGVPLPVRGIVRKALGA